MEQQTPAYREPFPILYVADAGVSARFYEQHFGFERSYVWPADGPPEFVFLRLDGAGIGLARHDAGRRGQPAFELCIYVDDVDLASERLRAAGVRQLSAPEDQPWGERLAFFEDPDGHRIHITMAIEP